MDVIGGVPTQVKLSGDPIGDGLSIALTRVSPFTWAIVQADRRSTS